MVIDALRDSFLDNPAWTATRSHVVNGKVHIYTALVQTPTVTMPRLKAILAGISPAFADVVLNFASTRLTQDNWLSTAVKMGSRVEFYGDDTWLKLFDDSVFSKHEGVSSFYVKDYTEVDLNVTRNLNARLPKKEDWDVLVLHYLGLDHIGHLYGPHSGLVGPKLAEMDDVIGRVLETLEPQDILIVAGDHGMSDVGSHGGASASETRVGLLVASNGFKLGADHRSLPIQQVDLVPTVSTLLSIPWPTESVGLPMGHVLKEIGISETETKTMGVQWLCGSDTKLCGDLSEPTVKDLRRIQINLISERTDFNHWLIFFGLILIIIASLLRLKPVISSCRDPSVLTFMPIALILVRSLFLASSSFVEEEHQIWFHFCPTMVLVQFMLEWKRVKKLPLSGLPSLAMILVIHRVSRTINRHGDKWSHLPAVADLMSPILTTTLLILSVLLFLVSPLSVVPPSSRTVHSKWIFRFGIGAVTVFHLSQLWEWEVR